MKQDVATVSVTEFKARCLQLFSELEKRRLRKVVVTRHGKVVGEVTPPAAELSPIYGAFRGSISVAPGVDLTAPTFSEEEFDAGKPD